MTGDHFDHFNFADAGTVADLLTFVSRARTADDGAIRLQGAGKVLAASVCLMRGKLLGEGTPTILGMRTMALAEDSMLDVTVSLSSVADRLARMDPRGTEFSVPPVGVNESWAAVSPPRGAWQNMGAIDSDTLIAVAKDGVQEINQILPTNPGALIVNNARSTVWGKAIESAPAELPRGAAFAAYTLGFLAPGAQATVFSSHRWLRLSTQGGHILVRPTASL